MGGGHAVRVEHVSGALDLGAGRLDGEDVGGLFRPAGVGLPVVEEHGCVLLGHPVDGAPLLGVRDPVQVDLGVVDDVAVRTLSDDFPSMLVDDRGKGGPGLDFVVDVGDGAVSAVHLSLVVGGHPGGATGVHPRGAVADDGAIPCGHDGGVLECDGEVCVLAPHLGVSPGFDPFDVGDACCAGLIEGEVVASAVGVGVSFELYGYGSPELDGLGAVDLHLMIAAHRYVPGVPVVVDVDGLGGVNVHYELAVGLFHDEFIERALCSDSDSHFFSLDMWIAAPRAL